MAQPITEILQYLNENPKDGMIKHRERIGAMTMIFQHAYDPEKKFVLPDGDPPYKPAVEPLGMTPTNLYTELRRFYVFCRKDLKQLQREQLFVNLLEGIHPDEAKLMIAIKDQKIQKLYPKLTRKWAEEHRLVAPIVKAPKTPA
jgi:hypothetical protein